MKCINLKIPEHSYFFGFAQMDGSLTKSSRNRGKLQIELKEEDVYILRAFQRLFPSVNSSIRKRIRNTNFKNNYISYVLAIFNQGFREEINKLGIPYGKKSETISLPKSKFCERDYIRGLVDGDGSVGMTVRGFPFISITVKSEELKDYLLNVIERTVKERKRLARNKRDNIYNIILNREKAQQFIRYLYYPNALALKRKVSSTRKGLKWKRPKTIKRIFQKFWGPREDKYILNHPVEESCHYLKRTERSIKMRLWRFKNNKAQYLKACLSEDKSI